MLVSTPCIKRRQEYEKVNFILFLAVINIVAVGLIGCEKKAQAPKPVSQPAIMPPPAPAPETSFATPAPEPTPAKQDYTKITVRQRSISFLSMGPPYAGAFMFVASRPVVPQFFQHHWRHGVVTGQINLREARVGSLTSS